MPDRDYLFLVRDPLPQPKAYLVQMVHLANAAANLGYRAVLAYPRRSWRIWRWFGFGAPRAVSAELRRYYQLQDRLQILPVDLPPWSDRWGGKWFSASTLLCKFHLPVHWRRRVGLVHSRDWNFVQAALQQGIAAIYERDHCETKHYPARWVNDPQLLATVTVADPVRANLIANGMPPEKIVQLHNGFNRAFADRDPDNAKKWRSRLLTPNFEQLVVYAGALEPFKGIDLLVAIAPQFPQVQFALAGGPPKQQAAYAQQLKERNVTNVELVGYLPHEHLIPLLQAADVLVYPHCSGAAATFTSPMKLFDYIAAGRAIVATTIPPLQEFQASPLIAAWSEPDDPQAFAQQLQQVLTQLPPWTPESLHRRADIEPFSWESRIEQTLTRADAKLRQTLQQ